MPLWTKALSYCVLVGIGFLIGLFYSERSMKPGGESPISGDAYITAAACPTYTLRRVREVLQNDDITVPPKARKQLRAERQALLNEICSGPGRQTDIQTSPEKPNSQPRKGLP